VDYYGAVSPLRTIAGISAPDAQSLVIQPYDISAMSNIEKAILKSDLGITPSNDGKVIRINIPPLTAVRHRPLKSNAHIM
jgi:ribosome recycling factor